MAKYRKKPVEIEAFQYDGDFTNKDGCYYVPAWAVHANVEGTLYFEDGELYVKTLEGIHHASVGDYIIRGVKGELYPCKPDIFEMTYGAVETIAVEERKECDSENNKKLNKISIKCDGEEIVINTEFTLEESAKSIYYHKEIGSSLIYIKDDLYRKTIFLNPRAVSLIKDVTDDESIIPFQNSEWCNKLATEVIKRINEHHKNQGIILKL